MTVKSSMTYTKNPPFHGIDPSWAAFGSVPVTHTPSDLCAPTLLTSLKVQSPKDAKQLTEVEELAYKEECGRVCDCVDGSVVFGLWRRVLEVAD